MVKKKSKKKKFGFEREFGKALDYIRDSRMYIFVVFGIFLVLFLAGFVTPFLLSGENLDKVFEVVQEWIKEILEETKDFNFLQMWGYLFKNNSFVSFISLFTGFLFALVPIIFLLSNGYFIGLVSGFLVVVGEQSVSSLWRLLPHGIFEIPAIIISFSLGIKFGTFIFHKNPGSKFKEYLFNSIRVFIFVILPLLFIAAVIESMLITLVG